MSFKKFSDTDVLINSVKLYPKNNYVFYGGELYNLQDAHVSSSLNFEKNVQRGDLSLYELNINRKQNLIYPFVEKGGSHVSLSGVSQTAYNGNFGYGDVLTGSYPLSASLSRDDVNDLKKRKLRSLQIPMRKYINLSPHFQWNSDAFGSVLQKDVGLINIPKIFYGDRLRKGSLELNMYLTGTLVGTLKDVKENGELIQTGPYGSTGSGSVAGLALYDEGVLLLTGSWALTSASFNFDTAASPAVNTAFQWRDFFFGLKDGNAKGSYGDIFHSGSYQLKFEGQNTTEVMTMFCHAEESEMNYSNNPTYRLKSDSLKTETIDNVARIVPNSVKNTVTGSFYDLAEKQKNQVFINTIGIYDKNKKLIAIAKLAKPVRKRENDSFTFKLKMDI
jgi:hypothetical protein